MPDLREQLQHCFQGRVCMIGLGNTDYGDDGFGVRLAEQLAAAGVRDVAVAGASPERVVGRVAGEGFNHLIFLDAVEFGGAPGSVVFLNAEEMVARFPQISTHKVSLSLLAKWAESNGATRAWLLGVQPESLRQNAKLSASVDRTLKLLVDLLRQMKPKALDCCEHRSSSWAGRAAASHPRAVVPTAVQSLRLQQSEAPSWLSGPFVQSEVVEK